MSDEPLRCVACGNPILRGETYRRFIGLVRHGAADGLESEKEEPDVKVHVRCIDDWTNRLRYEAGETFTA